MAAILDFQNGHLIKFISANILASKPSRLSIVVSKHTYFGDKEFNYTIQNKHYGNHLEFPRYGVTKYFWTTLM